MILQGSGLTEWEGASNLMRVRFREGAGNRYESPVSFAEAVNVLWRHNAGYETRDTAHQAS